MLLGLIAALSLLAASAAAQPPSPAPAGAAAGGDAAGTDAEVARITAPVVLDGETLFRVRGTSAYPAEERARRISERIQDAAQTRSIAAESVRAAPADGSVNVTAGDRVLAVVTDADARVEGVNRTLLATAIAERVQRALRAYRQAREPAVLLRGLEKALGATIGFLAALLALRWIFLRLEGRFARQYEERIHGLQFQSFEILRAGRIRGLAHAVMSVARTVSGALLAYVWLHVVLASFPLTRPVADRLLAFLLAPVSHLGTVLVAELPDLALLAVLYFLTRWLLGLTRLFFEAVERRQVSLSGFEPEWALPTYRIARIAIVVIALVVAYPYIPGSRSAAFQGITILLGVMLSIGSSSFISNVVAGYAMIYRRAFHVGDRIGVGDTMGDVTEMRLQVTHLRSIKNEEIVVPNSTLLANSVVNYSALARGDGLILHTNVGIGYETPWRQVEAMLLLAAERTPGLGRTPPPFVLQRSLGDFCVVYELNVPCDAPARMLEIYTELHRSILDVFNEYGVQIMTPAYRGDPEQPKVVPREQWWSEPARSNGGTGAPSKPRAAKGRPETTESPDVD